MACEIEKIMFDCVSTRHMVLQMEMLLGTFHYIDHYTVKNFVRLLNVVVDNVLKNLDDYFEIFECVTSVLFNYSCDTTVVLKVFSISVLLRYKLIAMKEKSLTT